MIGQSAGKAWSYLLGVYLGDGCITVQAGYPVFRLNTIDADFADAVKEAAVSIQPQRRVNICRHAVSKSSRDNYALRVHAGQPFIAMRDETQDKQIIPAYVHDWCLENRQAFITGLMDSEGFVGQNKNPTNRRFYMGFKCCDPWFYDFVRVLNSAGIQIGKIGVEQPLKPGYKTPRRLTIKMQSWLDSGCAFHIARKQIRVDLWASKGAYESRAAAPRKQQATSETLRHAEAA